MSQILALTDTGLNLLSFPRLVSLNTHFPEKQNGNSLQLADCSVAKQQPLVLQWYDDQKTVEALKVKVENGKACMTRVKKLNGGNLRASSYAIPRKECNEMAVGYVSGHIRIVNLQTNTRTKTLNPEMSNNPVAMMDFNCNDDYIGVLYDNGTAAAFNVKTTQQSEKIKVKGDISQLKYHETKTYMIGVATLASTVIVWDTNRHVALYNEQKAHDAPIRDISWDLDHPDYLYTASYDCKVKIYDIRKRACAMEIKGDRPLNCLAVSQDGNFVATGNLACVVQCYDVRHSKQPISQARLSQTNDDKIKRLSILLGLTDLIEEPVEIIDSAIPEEGNGTANKEMFNKRNSGVDGILAEFKAIKAGRLSDSPGDSSVESRNLTVRRTFDRRSSIMSVGGKRISDAGGQNLLKFLNFSLDANDSAEQEYASAIDDSHVNTDRLQKRKSCPQAHISPVDTIPNVPIQHRSASNISNSRGSTNDSIVLSETPKNSERRNRISVLKEVDENQELKITDNKENIEAGHIFSSFPKEKTSTPNIPPSISKIEQPSVETPPTILTSQTSVDLSQVLMAIQSLQTEMKSEIQALRKDVNTKIENLNDEIDRKFLEFTQHYNFKSEEDKFHVFAFVRNSIRRTEKLSEDMDETMALLVRNMFKLPMPMQLNVPDDFD